MKQFKFRLQRVLEYREMQEGWAKDAYIEARAARLDSEATIASLQTRRREAMTKPISGIEDRRTLDRYLLQIDEEERTHKHVVTILEEEEGKALATWQGRKQELEVMVKLREKALEQYQLDATRLEQAELDEWSTMRKPA